MEKKGRTPEEYIKATSEGKLDSVAIGDQLVVSCDTVVVVVDKANHEIILEKPESEKEAFEMIKGLLGAQVRVISAVWMRRGDRKHCFIESTQVEMRTGGEIGDDDIRGYLQTVDYK